MKRATQQAGLWDELVVDLFAGLGGASIGIEAGLVAAGYDRPIDIAVNHSRNAIACHMANHPRTRHLHADVFEVDPVTATGGRPVGLLWCSPDCTHFSKARGGKPCSPRVRSLAWVAVRWMSKVRPRLVLLENVEEFTTWGPLDKTTGRPCPRKKGMTFKRWITQIRNLGYAVEWRELRACDYGSPTIRKRLFVIARCDGLPIVWPEKTHGGVDHRRTEGRGAKRRDIDQLSNRRRAARRGQLVSSVHSRREQDALHRGVQSPRDHRPGRESTNAVAGRSEARLKPYRTAAECIAWDLPCPSIFLTREEARSVGCKRPLADATMKRIANGIRRYVIEAKEPFIVRTGHYSNITGEGMSFRGQSTRKPLSTVTSVNDYGIVTPIVTPVTHQGNRRSHGADEPMPTVTGAHRGEHALVAPTIVPIQNYGSDSNGNSVSEPLRTITAHPKGGTFSLVSAFLAKHYGGVIGTDVREPIGTVTAVDHHSLAVAHLAHLRGTNRSGHAANEPAPTITGGGTHLAEVRAFLCAYFGNDKDGQSVRDPMRTVTAKERFGLVTVEGTDYQIVDIGMRMLTPRELARAQGFPESYHIDVGPGGRTLTKTEQVKLIGNSVCPQVSEALVKANYVEAKAVEVSA